MKLGLGLYRHMLTQEYYDFARQAGCTDVVVHLTDYFREGATNARNNQPSGGKYDAWGIAGDPDSLWTVAEMKAALAGGHGAYARLHCGCDGLPEACCNEL